MGKHDDATSLPDAPALMYDGHRRQWYLVAESKQFKGVKSYETIYENTREYIGHLERENARLKAMVDGLE